jgi:hypothetical protein
MQYYPFQKKWRNLKAIYNRPSLREMMVRGMDRKVLDKASGYDFRFAFYGPVDTDNCTPSDYDSCDWRFDIPGNHPAYFKWACHDSAYWLSPVHHRAAMIAEPKMDWELLCLVDAEKWVKASQGAEGAKGTGLE